MIILDDFENNNIEGIESFYSSAVYNRLNIPTGNSSGFYIFVPNFGDYSVVTVDVHWENTRVQSGNLTANARAIANYINNKSELRAKGITAKIINNYQIGTFNYGDAILILCESDYEDILFSCTPYYLVRSQLDSIQDDTNNKVRFTIYKYDPNILYSSILSDEQSELENGTQILSPDVTFVGNNYASYKNLVNNYLGYYKEQKTVITLTVDINAQNLLPLETIQVRLAASNIEKYPFLDKWNSYETYYYLDMFLIGSTKLSQGVYKFKLKEI